LLSKKIDNALVSGESLSKVDVGRAWSTGEWGEVIAKSGQASKDAAENVGAEESPAEKRSNRWIGLVKATASPLKLFALIVLICNSVFGVAAAWSYDESVFIYTLHTFLFVIGAFVLIALWSPRSFYSPSELAELVEIERRSGGKVNALPSNNPLQPTLILGGFVIAYGLYQLLLSLA